MQLDILRTLNAERAARRPVVVVTDLASGAQRLVKAADFARDPLKEPIEKRIRSWIFDSDGGYGQAFWTRDGNRWLLKETRVSPDGSESSAEQTLTYIDQDHCTFESANRTLDGDPLPNISKIEINRVKTQ